MKGTVRFGSKRAQAHEGRWRTPTNHTIVSASPHFRACGRASASVEDVVEGGARIEETSRMIGTAERLDGALWLQGSGDP